MGSIKAAPNFFGIDKKVKCFVGRRSSFAFLIPSCTAIVVENRSGAMVRRERQCVYMKDACIIRAK